MKNTTKIMKYGAMQNGVVIATFETYLEAVGFLLDEFGMNYETYDCGITTLY
jgi:hypothetical protein